VRALASIHHAFAQHLPEIHAKRLSAVFAVVGALLRCGSVIGAKMGRSIAIGTTHKHGIKRIDRLLGNHRLQPELEKLYAALAALLLRGEKRPVVLVDWTEVGSNKCAAITAALALHGRAVTIFAQVYSIHALNSHTAHTRFMRGLARVLGPEVRPIIVADAGFHAPFMKLVLSHGWDYVCRVRGRIFVGAQDASWGMTAKAFYAQARRTPLDVPNGLLGQTRGVFATRLVLADLRSARAKKPPKLRGRRIYTVRAVKRAHEPWLLATSLRQDSAERVLSLYGLRMQIEASYRDMKSARLGWGLEHAQTRTASRLAVQVALAAIAAGVVILAGLAAERQGIERYFQANTVRTRRVLSLAALGRMALNDERFACRLKLGHALRDLRVILALLASPEWGDS
jgi:hypothetical protein